MDLKWTAFVVEYEPGEKYSGLDTFKEERKTRVRHFATDEDEPHEYHESAAKRNPSEGGDESQPQ